MRKFQVVVNGNSYEVEVEELGAGVSAAAPVATPAPVKAAPVAQAPIAPPKTAVALPAGATKIVAPMPGKIVSVRVSVGQAVKEGDLVGVLEAMKMENEIFSSASGTIASVNVHAGDTVETGDVIVTIN